VERAALLWLERGQKLSPLGRTVRCAIYTRKSTEEGLEQDYNSLHAQRDACAAYVSSQTGKVGPCFLKSMTTAALAAATWIARL
jgi:hypothetical protein